MSGLFINFYTMSEPLNIVFSCRKSVKVVGINYTMNVYIRFHEEGGGVFLSLSCLCGLCIDRDTRQAVLFCRLSIQNKNGDGSGALF